MPGDLEFEGSARGGFDGAIAESRRSEGGGPGGGLRKSLERLRAISCTLCRAPPAPHAIGAITFAVGGGGHLGGGGRKVLGMFNRVPKSPVLFRLPRSTNSSVGGFPAGGGGFSLSDGWM